MTGSALDLSTVAVHGDAGPILRDVDLHVAAGSRVAIVGPSGAGKTTLLRAVAGLAPLAAGSVRVDGRDVAGRPPHRRGMAAVFQQPRLFPNMDARDNVAYPLRLRRVPRGLRRSRAEALLDEVGLAGFGKRNVRSLSGGEARRVALARALAAEPRLLLLDEPLVGVDPARRRDLVDVVLRLHERHHMTMLVVTHDRAEAAELGEMVALVIEGRVWQHAPARELFERPASTMVARFFGVENIVQGDVRDGRLALAGGWLPVSGPDGPATVCIRPERIAVAVDGPLAAEVRRVAYLGSHQRVEVDAGQPLVLEAPSDLAIRVGDRVALAVAASAVWRLPDTTGTAVPW